MYTVIIQPYFPEKMTANYSYVKRFCTGIVFVLLIGCGQKDVTTPIKRDIIDVVFASGHLVKDNEYVVTANTEGFLVHSLVREGDSVRVGDDLFQLSNKVQSTQLSNALVNYRDAQAKVAPDSPQLTQIRLQIDQAETQLETDRKNYERHKSLLQTNAISELDYDKAELQYQNSKTQLEVLKKSLVDLKQSLNMNLENAKAQLEIQQENNSDYFLKAQIDGTVLNVYKEQGELVKRGENIARIGGGTDIIKLFVAEEDISRVRAGQMAKISLNTEKERTFDAKISKVYPAFDDKEQSFVLEATFIRPPSVLYAGTQLQANIVIANSKDALVIPTSYLTQDNGVILEKDEREVPITIGVQTGEWTQVLEGLGPTTKIKAPNTKEK